MSYFHPVYTRKMFPYVCACVFNIMIEKGNIIGFFFSPEPFIMFRLSFLLYGPMGVGLIVLCGLAASLCLGESD